MQKDNLYVDLGDRAYPIHISPNGLSNVKSLLDEHVSAEKYFLISDSNVAELYAAQIKDALDIESTYICSVGEGAKSFAVFEEICEQFLSNAVTRKSAIITLGGGVVGDLAGFVASSLLRGVKFVQIPTTLLAQVDSSVGGKTAINSKHGKNLIGAFYQPQLVIVDTGTLSSLPKRQIYAGYAEILKYALINDPEFFVWLDENAASVLQGDQGALEYAVRKSCEKKADIVARDEREGGCRALLNLGHTFAHALELEAGYDGTLLHGEAVMIGMRMAMEFSVHMNICPKEDLDRLNAHYSKFDLMPEYKIKSDADTLIKAMTKDKKNIRDTIVFILLKGLGKAYVDTEISRDNVKEFLVKYLKAIQT